MTRAIHKLSARKIQTASPGKYCDGGGLWLFVSPAGARNWVFRYRLHGRDREMGLGSAHTVSLAKARKLAAEYRELRHEGRDPIEYRNQKRLEERLRTASPTFSDCVDAYIEAHRAGWSNAKHARQWHTTLRQYACPEFGELPVRLVETTHVLRALEKIWYDKTETANRVRQRIEAVLDWATARKYRMGENPARWRGHLDKLLPRPTRVKKPRHHPALPFGQIAGFMHELRQANGIAARALEFTVLTAARTSEVIAARWEEIDLTHRVWTVPAERMKARREHRVPLSDQAVALLKGMPRLNDYLFPGLRKNRPLSNMAMAKLLKEMGYKDYTVHGFRSTFRDWVAETTNYPRELAEAALAHVVKDKTEAAYQRGDLLARRAELMQAWADWCDRAQTGGEAEYPDQALFLDARSA
ncbi:MAG TPA: site-specific integrase [Gammaproteobacteria bacterium]|nr:site-specific integrase [Gammaproteobacteria bacterium]